jgi:hypothetical protein
MELGYERDDCELVEAIRQRYPILSEFNCACALEAARQLVLEGCRPPKPADDVSAVEDAAEDEDEAAGDERDEIDELLTEEGAMEGLTWTPERHAQLCELFRQDVSTAEIARRMGLTKGAVIGRLHRSGMSRRTQVAVSPGASTEMQGQFDLHFVASLEILIRWTSSISY